MICKQSALSVQKQVVVPTSHGTDSHSVEFVSPTQGPNPTIGSHKYQLMNAPSRRSFLCRMTCVILGVAAVGAGVSAVGRYALPLRDSIAIGDCLELVQVSRSLDLNDTNSKVIQELAGDIKHIADSLEALALPDELLVLREEYEQQLTLRCAMFEYASNRKAPTQAEVEQDIARLQAGKDKIDQTLARAQKNPEILTGFQDEMSVVDFFQNWVAKLPNSQTG